MPFDGVFQARMVLASEGFPKDGSGIGFESLYLQQEMGVSSFMEEARYHRAVEAELVRTITALDSVTALEFILRSPGKQLFCGGEMSRPLR